MLDGLTHSFGNVGKLHNDMLGSISGYAAQPQKHTGIGWRLATRRYMEKTPDQRREILRTFINTNGLKIATWAKASGVDKNSIYNFLNGHSQALDIRTYAKLARTAQIPLWKLTGDQPEPPSPSSIWVSGAIEAGVFMEATDWPQADWYAVDVPIPERFRGKAKALQVRGSSMNVDYPDGSIAIYVDMLDFRPPRDGDDVIAVARRRDGMQETTLKTYRLDDRGGKWLWPRSHDPLHQSPVNTQSPPDETETIEIRGIVIGCYRAWHH